STTIPAAPRRPTVPASAGRSRSTALPVAWTRSENRPSANNQNLPGFSGSYEVRPMEFPIAHGTDAPPQSAQPPSICFIVDPDFGSLQGFCRSLRRVGVDTVELITSARLAEHVDAQHPDIVFVDLDPVHSTECARALMALRECRFAGRVQLFGRCKLPLLEEFRRLRADAALTMLPVLQKPIDFASIQKIVLEQQLNCAAVAPPGLSLQTPLPPRHV